MRGLDFADCLQDPSKSKGHPEPQSLHLSRGREQTATPGWPLHEMTQSEPSAPLG